MIAILPFLVQAVTTAAPAVPHLLNLQTLQTFGTSLGGSAAMTPFFNGLGQLIKQHPKLNNDHVRWILPLIAALMALGVIAGYIALGTTPDPFALVGIFALFVGGAFASEVVFGIAKNTNLLPTIPSGPEAPGVGANVAPPPVAIAPPAPIQMGNVMPPNLPPSPNLPPH